MLIQLDNLLEEDPGSNVVIHCDPKTKVISSIFFQTSWMKDAFERYPEVLEIDTTHKLCENNMALTVYEVVDCFGAGRIAGYALLSNESCDVVTESLQVLVKGCSDSSKKTLVVMIDKDPSEINAALTLLPKAEVHLCDWHVKEIFDREGTAEMGARYKQEVQGILEKMRFSHTETACNSICSSYAVDKGLVTAEDRTAVVDSAKMRRQTTTVFNKATTAALDSCNQLCGIYFDGRKNDTQVQFHYRRFFWLISKFSPYH